MRGRYPDAVGIDVINAHALGLADVASRTPLTTQVPSCPGWTMADLVWHLTDVELFWARIIEGRPVGPDAYEQPARPGDSRLIVGLERAVASLVGALVGLDPEESAWSWSQDHSVGFTLRRQSHEALIHHADATLAAGVDLPTTNPLLAADGVDEMVDVMLTGVPEWASFERRAAVIELRSDDTGDSWTLGFGRMTGTSPESGSSYDIPALEPVDEPPDAVVAGSAVDLDLWLWGRADRDRLDVSGDHALVDELRTAAMN